MTSWYFSQFHWKRVPPGKLAKLWTITLLNGSTNYTWSFSIAMLVDPYPVSEIATIARGDLKPGVATPQQSRQDCSCRVEETTTAQMIPALVRQRGLNHPTKSSTKKSTSNIFSYIYITHTCIHTYVYIYMYVQTLYIYIYILYIYSIIFLHSFVECTYMKRNNIWIPGMWHSMIFQELLVSTGHGCHPLVSEPHHPSCMWTKYDT